MLPYKIKAKRESVRTTMTLGILFTLFLLPPSAIAEQHTASKSHAVTHEDVWLMHRVDTPEPSPDGHWAVVSVTEPSYEEDGDVSDLWLVATDGSLPPRRLTSTPDTEYFWNEVHAWPGKYLK